jgi:hypothetical protein
MMRDTIRRVLALSAVVLLSLAQGAAAQQTCREIEAVLLQCPEGGNIISGDPPYCFCEGLPVEPLKLTCEVNFACPSASYVAFGDFPECGCRPKEGGGTIPDGNILPGPDPISVDICKQYLECPSGAQMQVMGGQCACSLVMLPEFKD